MREHHWPKKAGICIAAVVAISIASIFNICSYFSNQPGNLRRSLSTTTTRYLHASHSTLLPWAHYNLRSVHEIPDPATETALFWHIPKSGGTTAKRLYECLGQVLANRLGANARFGHDKDSEIVVFQPFDSKPEIKFVNVDTTSKEGILRAEKLGLVASKKVDMIFTSDINFAGEHLFDRSNKARVFALFRNPVDRSVSKFYYLQSATWEKTYRPEWKGMSVIDWATNHNLDENFMVKKIIGKRLADTVDMGDLIIAKEIVRRRFIVGLMSKMEESIRRFNVILGMDESNEKNEMCMEQFFGTHENEKASNESEEKHDAEESNRNIEDKAKSSNNMNSNSHPKVLEGSPEWDLLAERNSYDMILYNYILLLYDEQKSIIGSYANGKGKPEENTSPG